MNKPFEHSTINGMKLANRFVISMSRPLIREPDLINRWRAGDLSKAACVSDNMCFRPAVKGEGIYCLTEERERNK
jgi:2,4-dienoyl-CoA reductase-like NADH-dependent reductase (Old Yellow Enzyme family)